MSRLPDAVGIPDAPALEMARELHDRRDEPVVVVDAALRIHWWNPAMEALTGLDHDQVTGLEVLDVVDPEQVPGLEAPLAGTLEGRTCVLHGTLPWLGVAAAMRRTFDTFCLPANGPDGLPAGGVLVCRQRKEVGPLRERIGEIEARFRTMADCAPVLLWMAGPDGMCEFFNRTWLEFTGRTMDEELGVGWAQGVHPEDFQHAMDTYMAAFRQRRSFTMDYRLRRRDGQYRWILDKGSPRYTAEGRFCGYIGSCIDVTERREAEERTRRMARSLARSNAELERFAYAASHHLQEPLRIVATYCDLLEHRHGDALGPSGRRAAHRARIAARRMQDHVQGVLELTAVEREDAPRDTVDAAAACSAAVRRLGPVIEETGAVLDIQDLPRVMANALQLEQLFEKLLGNALRYRGTASPEVRVTAERSGEWWCVAVTDNGPGIDPRYHGHVFEPFSTLEGQGISGSGIGLAVSRRIVERHGGTLEVESAPDRGATFRFTLRAADG